MNFKCEDLSIEDDKVFGCTITFSDTADDFEDNFDSSELINSNERYLMIQRSYAEDFDEEDYYSVETTESNTAWNERDQMIIRFNDNYISFEWYIAKVDIGIDLDIQEMKRLKSVLKRKFKNRIIIAE